MVLWNWRVAARWMVVAFVLALMLPASAGSIRAQATPTPIPLDVPAPRECQIAPRAMPLFPEGTGQPVPATPPAFATPTAFTPPTGEPADEETIAAVTATVREALACRNANDFLRAYALFTQEGLTALFGGPATIDPEIRAAVAEDLRPAPAEKRVALIAVADVTVLPDGRVSAAVETVNARQLFHDSLIFAYDEASGRWLIDGSWVMGDR